MHATLCCTYVFGHLGLHNQHHHHHQYSTQQQHQQHTRRDEMPQEQYRAHQAPMPPPAPAPNEPYVPAFDELLRFQTYDVVKKWIQQWSEMVDRGDSEDSIRAWFNQLKLQYGPKLIAEMQCPKHMEHFTIDWASLPKTERVGRNGECQCDK